MKFKAGDTCLEDYQERRRIFLKKMVDEDRSDKERLKMFREWIETNSPYTAAERLENLKAALREEWAP